MKFSLPLSLLFVLLPAQSAEKMDFSRDIRPIFNSHCTACHGGVKEAGEISFIYRDKALGKGESGKFAIVPGNPAASEVMARIVSTDPDDIMPKPEHGPPLQKNEIEALRQWISEGAKWGEHWSFVAPVDHPLPEVAKKDWPAQPLDHFILARLESKQLKPAAEADPSQWLRRASFDLTGLPPTMDELETFQQAAAQDHTAAMFAATDRLLESPRFGERWASVWMDLARYADSAGYADDNRRQVWKYRDWLIGALNRDLPFDQFTIEQIAGDLLPDATLDQKIATTFSRLSQVNNEGGTDDEEFRVVAVIDRINTTWEAWMGLSFGCVQCHSHPYDPIRHEEYYKFMEFFNQTVDADLIEDHPLTPVPIDPALNAAVNSLLVRSREAKHALHALRGKIDASSKWFNASRVSAQATKAELTITEEAGIAEFRADTNVADGAEYKLTFETAAPVVSALRLQVLPLDLAKALHTPEWGFVINKMSLEAISSDGVATAVKLREVIADEAEPFLDPNLSLKGSDRGWGAYSKLHAPRHATFVLEQPLTSTPGMKLRVTIKNGPKYLVSYPMVVKRGRISVTDQSEWITQFDSEEVLRLKQIIATCTSELKAIPSTTVPTMAQLPTDRPRVTHLFRRGNWLDKTDFIREADTPRLFPSLKKNAAHPASRLDLARWIAAPENPLTARVAVNRLWLELFGTGIVPTPEDFGSAGEPPTHPELLDHLALRFVNDKKWSLKAMLRELVTSRTYRQDHATTQERIEADPGNRLITRGPRQRLTAEMVRDHSLTTAGLIAHQVGGAPVHPPLPPGVWKPFTPDEWKTPPPGDPQRYRRAVYIYFKRSLVYPLFGSFDVSARDISTKRRMVSNTPIQALTTLNDAAFDEAAKAMAQRMEAHSAADIVGQIAYGYELATSATITADRSKELHDLFQRLQNDHQSSPQEALAVVASVIMNLDESLTR